MNVFKMLEASSLSALLKKVLLKFSQNSQVKNTCAKNPFLIKLQAKAYHKRISDTGVFLWILRNF